MKIRQNKWIVLSACVGITVLATLLGLLFLLSVIQNKRELPIDITSPEILHENALPGTTNWQIPDASASSTQIQAYASATSVQPGQMLTFYVSTQKQGTPYTVAIYRLGWYGGAGGRLMTSRMGQIGQAQGYYDSQTHRLVNCHSCHVNTQTGLEWQFTKR